MLFAVREIHVKELVSIVRLVYCTLIITHVYTCTCINMSVIEDIAGTEFDELLQQVHLRQLDIVHWSMNERLDMSDNLLGVLLIGSSR